MIREEDYNDMLRVLNTYINTDMDEIDDENDKEIAIKILSSIGGVENV